MLLESNSRTDDSERKAREVVPALALVRRRMIESNAEWHKELQRIEAEVKSLEGKVSSSWSAFTEASIGEIRAWKASQRGRTREARDLYQRAGVRLVDWLERTSSELLAKSVMLRLTQSPAEVESAYTKHYKTLVDESWEDAQARFFLESVLPRVLETTRSSRHAKEKLAESEIDQKRRRYFRFVLRYLQHGSYDISFFLLAWSNLDRREFFDAALDWVSELRASGDTGEATVLLATLYVQAQWIYRPWTQVYVLLRIALQCDSINTGFAKRIGDEIFEWLESGSCAEDTNSSDASVTWSTTLWAVGDVAEPLINQGRSDDARSLVARFLAADADACWDGGILVKKVALAFAENGEINKALDMVQMLNAAVPYRTQVLDDVYEGILCGDDLDIEAILNHMRVAYEDDVTPSLLRSVSEKAASYCKFDLALEIARSIDQPYARALALMYCARSMRAFHQLVLEKLSDPDVDLGLDAPVHTQGDRQIVTSIAEALQKHRVDQVVREACQVSEQAQDLVKGMIKTWIAADLRQMGRVAEATEIVGAAEQIAEDYPHDSVRSELRRGLARMDMAFENFENAYSRAKRIPLSFTRALTLFELMHEITREHPMAERVRESAAAAVIESVQHGVALHQISFLVREGMRTAALPNLQELADRAEATALFLRGKEREPAVDLIEVGWAFRNMELASTMFSKSGDGKAASRVTSTLDRLRRCSPLSTAPITNHEDGLLVHRKQMRDLRIAIDTRPCGLFAVYGSVGTGRSTLANVVMSQLACDIGCITVRETCSGSDTVEKLLCGVLLKLIEGVQMCPQLTDSSISKELKHLRSRLEFTTTIGDQQQHGVSVGHTGLAARRGRIRSTSHRERHFRTTEIRQALIERIAGSDLGTIVVIVEGVDSFQESDARQRLDHLLQELRPVAQIPSVFLVLDGVATTGVGLPKAHLQGNQFIDFGVNLDMSDEESSRFLKQVLIQRLEWLGLSSDFSDAEKDKLVARAESSATKLIQELGTAFHGWITGEYVT